VGDVPIWHPRTHDTKRKQCLRNFEDGKHIRMRLELSLPDHKAVYLVWSVLSTYLKDYWLNGRRSGTLRTRTHSSDRRGDILLIFALVALPKRPGVTSENIGIQPRPQVSGSTVCVLEPPRPQLKSPTRKLLEIAAQPVQGERESKASMGLEASRHHSHSGPDSRPHPLHLTVT